MDLIIGILAFVFAILQIILFFKIWGMTNNVSELKDFIINKYSNNGITQQPTSNKVAKISDDNINESRKITRLSDNKQLYVKQIIGDTYECLDPKTKEFIGRYKSYEIKKGW